MVWFSPNHSLRYSSNLKRNVFLLKYQYLNTVNTLWTIPETTWYHKHPTSNRDFIATRSCLLLHFIVNLLYCNTCTSTYCTMEHERVHATIVNVAVLLVAVLTATVTSIVNGLVRLGKYILWMKAVLLKCEFCLLFLKEFKTLEIRYVMNELNREYYSMIINNISKVIYVSLSSYWKGPSTALWLLYILASFI